jgi:hypothetical protein
MRLLMPGKSGYQNCGQGAGPLIFSRLETSRSNEKREEEYD